MHTGQQIRVVLDKLPLAALIACTSSDKESSAAPAPGALQASSETIHQLASLRSDAMTPSEVKQIADGLMAASEICNKLTINCVHSTS